jgi:sugar lactone lactonase YvrE
MKEKLRSAVILSLTIVVLLFTSSRLPADTDTCAGAMTTVPFTDIAGNAFFCQIAEAYFAGLTNGTAPTTFSPSGNVTRDQIAAFVTRTQDSALRRGNRRAALDQWATPAALPLTGRTEVGAALKLVKSDGADLWVAAPASGAVVRVRASDGRVLETWTQVGGPFGVLVARGRVFVSADTSPGRLFVIDPSTAPGPITTLSSALSPGPEGIATDGSFIWTANVGTGFAGTGSISRVDPDTGATTNITTGFSSPTGILFDGSNLWVTDVEDNKLKKLDSNGAILQSVTVGTNPHFPVFDGSNIWVPNYAANSVTVVRIKDGAVIATLTGNGLNTPNQAAFDGQRILVTNVLGSSVSLWKATDLTPLGTFSTGDNTAPFGVCSDGINFWIALNLSHKLARF